MPPSSRYFTCSWTCCAEEKHLDGPLQLEDLVVLEMRYSLYKSIYRIRRLVAPWLLGSRLLVAEMRGQLTRLSRQSSASLYLQGPF
jgi:hypothetical protein